jgi:hypothetical protein
MNNKPITLLRDEFINSMIELCNNSGLPFFVIEDVLKGMLQEAHNASVKQLEEDKKRYEEANKKMD